MAYIYIHTNTINGKHYIGQTTVLPNKRWRNGYGYRNQPHFYNAILKYGWDNFEHSVYECPEECLDQMEKSLIRVYCSDNPKYGYNSTDGGNKNKHFSKETREKMSNSRKGYHPSPISKEKNRQSHIGKEGYWKGKNRPSTTKQKISQSKKGYKQTDETKNKRAKSLSRPVCQYSLDGVLIRVWPSFGSVYRETGISQGCISKVCTNQRKSAGGFVWKYLK